MDSKLFKDTQKIKQQLESLNRQSKNRHNVDSIHIPSINLNLTGFFLFKFLILFVLFIFSSHLFASLFQIFSIFYFFTYVKNMKINVKMYLSGKYVGKYFTKIANLKKKGFIFLIIYAVFFAVVITLVAKFTPEDKMKFSIITLLTNYLLISVDFGINYWFFIGTKSISIGKNKYENDTVIDNEATEDF